MISPVLFGTIKNVARRLENPDLRVCRDCSNSFVATWDQRLCNPCRYERASRSVCASCGAKTGQSGRTICGPCRYGTPPEMLAMTGADRAWVAAIIEGEGTFAHTRRPCGLIRVAMTDLDVVERLKEITGLGLVHARGRRLAHHKDVWDWAVTRRENVCTLTEEIAPILLGRRRASAESVLGADGRTMPPPTAMRPGEPESWGWVAGLIEGEGCIVPGPSSKDQRPRISLDMTDFDVIERLTTLTSAGTTMEIASRRPRGRPLRRWNVSRKAEIRTVIENVMPHLGARRKERAAYALSRLLCRLLPGPVWTGQGWRKTGDSNASACTPPGFRPGPAA
jgi:hypothetical protein